MKRHGFFDGDRRLYLFVFLGLFWASGFLYGEEYITGLSVTGLKRTKLSTVERPLKKFIGADASQMNLDDVRAAILDTGILEPLAVEILDGDNTEEKILAVTVREKWPILPIPLFSAGSHGISLGLVFYDVNAFGLNDKFYAGGIYGKSDWGASIGYIHLPPEWGIPGWSGAVTFARRERRDKNQNNEDLRVYDVDAISALAGLSFRLLKTQDFLNAAVNITYDEKILTNPGNGMNEPESGLRVFGAGGEIALRTSSWDGYFLSQQALVLNYAWMYVPDGCSFHAAKLKLNYEKSLIPGFRLNLNSGLAFYPGVPVLFETDPVSSCTSILPPYFAARHYAGLSLGLEKHIVKFSFGSISLGAAYQGVYSQGSIAGDSFDHGPVGTVSFYLSKIAIPALGVGVAYNVKENFFQGSFTLGISL
ncbi:MAG: hypothetical protein LBD18_06375 [Treponema sp.]|jgi:hypothetical protein|nr:hypothetical protein [Treponema sp.]